MSFRVGLAFDDKARETAFVDEYLRRALPTIRVAQLTGLALFIVFGSLDLLILAPTEIATVWALRYGLACPAIFIAFLTTLSPRTQRFTEAANSISTAIAGLTICAMLGTLSANAAALYYVGLILVLMYGYTFVRLRFVASFFSGVTITVVYELMLLFGLGHQIETTFASSFFVVAANVMGITTSYLLERVIRDEYLARRAVEELATTDPLTGLSNRRYLDDKLGELIAIHRRYGTRFSVILIDLDDFKTVNDTHGYVTGDALLREVGRAISRTVRETDFAYRYGGDEFVVVLPETDAEGAAQLADRLLLALPETIPGADTLVHVSFSAGAYEIDASITRPDEVIMSASTPLRRAKREGKRRVHRAEAPPPS